MEYQAKHNETNIYQRVAGGGEETINAALEMIQGYNLPLPNNRHEMAKSLIQAVAVYGEPAYQKMIKFHPDYHAIVSNAIEPHHGKHHNDCGCNHSDSGCHHSDSGAGAGVNTAEKAASVAVALPPTKFDIQHFALIMVMTVGGLAFLTMLMGQGYLHMQRMNK